LVDAGSPLIGSSRRCLPARRDAIGGPASANRDVWLADFAALDAELIVPLGCQGILTGFLACGRPRSGAFFRAGDVSFLHTFANQAALSLQNARTFHDLELLNADLERRVNERTRQLGESTEQLSASLDQLGNRVSHVAGEPGATSSPRRRWLPLGASPPASPTR